MKDYIKILLIILGIFAIQVTILLFALYKWMLIIGG